MRTLLLMRHAKSSWKDESLADNERPLNERGKSAATCMGRFLAANDLVPDVIVCSTAKRARQTAKRVKKAAGCEADVIKSAALYFRGPSAYLDAAAQVSADAMTALIIGHNPDLESLVFKIAGKHFTIPTAAIVHLIADVGEWTGLAEGRALRIEGVYRPKELGEKLTRRKARRPRRRPRTS